MRITFPPWKDTLIISPAFALLTQLSLIHGIYSGDQSNANSHVLWGVETHRLAGPTPPNWRVGGKREGLYRLEIGSEIDLETWQYDLATEPSRRLARRRRRF